MALALGHPAGGYYTAAAARPTRSGDFLTAPELHPIFGAALATAGRRGVGAARAARCPSRSSSTGPAPARSRSAILAGLRDDGSPLVARAPLRARRAQRAPPGRAPGAGRRCGPPAGRPRRAGRRAGRPASSSPTSSSTPSRSTSWRSATAGRARSTSGSAATAPSRRCLPSCPTPRSRSAWTTLAGAGVDLVEGQRLEVRPAVGGVGGRGGPTAGGGPRARHRLRRPGRRPVRPRRRRAGTLMTYRGHAADGSPDAPYRDVGERDITAHVDTTALGAALAVAGLDLLGETTQAELLVGLRAARSSLQREPRPPPRAAAALELRSAVMRLLDPRHLGGFRAVLAGRGIARRAAPARARFRIPDRQWPRAPARWLRLPTSRPGQAATAGRARRHAAASIPCYDATRTLGTPGSRACVRLTRASRRAGGHRPCEPRTAGRREVRWKASGTSSASPSRASSFVFLTIGASWLISHRTKGSRAQGPAVRERHRHVRRHPRAVRRLVLHLRAALRRLRHRGGLHLPVGAGRARPDPGRDHLAWRSSSGSSCSAWRTPGGRGC